jgi:hypothetical protein
MSKHSSGPLSDAIIVAVAQLLDDAQTGRRDPSHSDLDTEFKRVGLTEGDPKYHGQTVGKAKRIRSTLSWALEHNPDAGAQFISSFIGTLRGYGAFRETSPNYVGRDAIDTAVAAFASEGFELSHQGELQQRLLESLSGAPLTEALQAYIRRAKRGANDAALVTGTGKDLLEAVAAHILQQRYGTYSATSNFPTLLGQVFIALGLATPMEPVLQGEPATKRIERAMYELACGINQLRNQQGTGHGRPWLPSVGVTEARMAIESMGIIAERLLNLHLGLK